MEEPILKIENLKKAYDGQMVLNGIDLQVRQGKTMLIVTHEMQFAKAVADRVVFLDGGRIVEQAGPEEFFTHPKTQRAKKFLDVFTFEDVHAEKAAASAGL